jgi:hypothetical protein
VTSGELVNDVVVAAALLLADRPQESSAGSIVTIVAAAGIGTTGLGIVAIRWAGRRRHKRLKRWVR